MTNLTDLHVTDGLTQVLATQYNRVVDSAIRGDMANVETLAADKTLINADYPLQVYAPTAARDVTLPAVGAANHPYYIVNTSASYALTVKNAGGTTILVIPISSGGFIASDGSTWHAVAGGQVAYASLSGLPTLPAGAIVGVSDTQTLTNKRITPRVNTTTTSGTPAINTDTTDIFTITALAEAITSMTTGLSGSPTTGQKLIIRIKDNATARAIAWGASFASRGATLPTTTVLSKTLYVGLIWNEVATTWDCVATSQEA